MLVAAGCGPSNREKNMSAMEIAYAGNQKCVATRNRDAKRVVVDCPLTRGEELGPGDMVAAGLGSCMLISMAGYAERHGLDVEGAKVDVDVRFGGRPQSRISSIEVRVHVPKAYGEQDRSLLEKAANACPIKHSFGSDTKISTSFEFDVAEVAASH
jgi:uncharacterized OsmC-like protein